MSPQFVLVWAPAPETAQSLPDTVAHPPMMPFVFCTDEAMPLPELGSVGEPPFLTFWVPDGSVKSNVPPAPAVRVMPASARSVLAPPEVSVIAFARPATVVALKPWATEVKAPEVND